MIIIAFIAGCKKKSVPGTVLLTIKSGTITCVNTKVYMHRGTRSQPAIALSEFDSMALTDQNGIAIFDNLDPDEYYFYSVFIQQQDTLKGSTAITIDRSQNINRRELILQVQ
jgi:hypothetical protein